MFWGFGCNGYVLDDCYSSNCVLVHCCCSFFELKFQALFSAYLLIDRLNWREAPRILNIDLLWVWWLHPARKLNWSALNGSELRSHAENRENHWHWSQYASLPLGAAKSHKEGPLKYKPSFTRDHVSNTNKQKIPTAKLRPSGSDK